MTESLVTISLFINSFKSSCCRCMEICKTCIIKNKVEIIINITDLLVSHPFLVLRRQCQVRGDAKQYHLTPISLIPVAITLIQKEGFKVLYKGLLSVVILRVVQVGVEHIMSRLTGWTTRFPHTWHINRDCLQHFLLKSFSLVITAPVYSMAVINTVTMPGTIDNSALILSKYDFPLPAWKVMLPSTVSRILKYTYYQTVLSGLSAMFYLNFCFDQVGRNACQSVQSGIRLEDKQDIHLKSTVASYLSAKVAFYPIDTIVHRLILQGTKTFTNDLDSGSGVVQIVSAYDGFWDCCSYVMWLEGKLGLYRGFGALLMQAFFYHYCIKFVSITWHYIRIYNRTISTPTLSDTVSIKLLKGQDKS